MSVYTEYVNAPEVTRKRMYLETMEGVLGDMNLTILDNVTGGESWQRRAALPAAERTGPPIEECKLMKKPLVCYCRWPWRVLAFSSLFIVDERENVLVLQFGQVKQEITEPGLGFKVPFIQDVVRYDARILGLQTQPLEVTPLDDRRLVVDAFLRWRLADVTDFREAVGLTACAARRAGSRAS